MSPTRRTDAERNREKILAVARAAFADPVGDVSMAEISRRAGVGMATLYRNFPGRHELLEAIYVEEVDAICATARGGGGCGGGGGGVGGDGARGAGAGEIVVGEGQGQAGTPGASFLSWLEELFAFFASKRHVASELLKHTDSADPVFGGSRARVTDAGRPLLAAGQNAGEIREDLDIEQVLDLVHAIATIHGDSGHVRPILQATLDGLRVTGDPQAEEKGTGRVRALLS